MKELNLQNSCRKRVFITAKGAKYISEAIQVNTTLQKLNLSGHSISDDGAAAISDSLKINVSLQELNLQSNEISDVGAKKMAEAIQVTTTLQKLDLHGNRISYDDKTAISDNHIINLLW